jgi:pimeloyl-ACP methyl ester carboxylesterase
MSDMDVRGDEQPMHLQAHARVEGGSLYYEIAGAGLPVVLIHGFTLDTRMWDDQFLPLAQRYRVLRYDQRGFGRSTLPGEQPYAHVEDLRLLLEGLRIERAALVGLSKGGAVALDFALAHPQRTAAVVLIDAGLRGLPWSAEGMARDEQIWEAAQTEGVAAAKRLWLQHPFFAPAQRNPPVAVRLAQIVDGYSGWHFLHPDPEQRPETPTAQRLHELAMPLLAIVGEEDIADFQAATDAICRGVPHAQKMVVPRVGHMANMEAPEMVTGAILAFLDACAAAQRSAPS